MHKHDWLIDVLDDIRAYAKKNRLAKVEAMAIEGKTTAFTEILMLGHESFVSTSTAQIRKHKSVTTDEESRY